MKTHSLKRKARDTGGGTGSKEEVLWVNTVEGEDGDVNGDYEDEKGGRR